MWQNAILLKNVGRTVTITLNFEWYTRKFCRTIKQNFKKAKSTSKYTWDFVHFQIQSKQQLLPITDAIWEILDTVQIVIYEEYSHHQRFTYIQYVCYIKMLLLTWRLYCQIWSCGGKKLTEYKNVTWCPVECQ